MYQGLSDQVELQHIGDYCNWNDQASYRFRTDLEHKKKITSSVIYIYVPRREEKTDELIP